MIVVDELRKNCEDASPKCAKQRIYLPSEDSGVDCNEYLQCYIKREFPDGKSPYSIPRKFEKIGEKQATLAEFEVFQKLKNCGHFFPGKFWMLFFHNSSYAGHSNRNKRIGKLMIREHDFVVFIKYNGKFYISLIEVKSTNDNKQSHLEKVSDAKIIKNNKRSAQHQLRDHIELIENYLKDGASNIQTYIMWPFLTAYTRDSKQMKIERWLDDQPLHVFQHHFQTQENFDQWLYATIIQNGQTTNENTYNQLINRYKLHPHKQTNSLLYRFIILSCGIFIDEINKNLLALLTQEQLELLNTKKCQQKALVVHGAAGTGKTLLVLKKLEVLHQSGRLNDDNRALYICYWPGIRYDMELKMESLGIRRYVDTARFYISLPDFLKNNRRSYKHIFMDEAEALCLALDQQIMQNTLSAIYRSYHDGNCHMSNCPYGSEDFMQTFEHHCDGDWGELWFMVDINQASLFLPKHSPVILKTPSIILTKVMRTTGCIFKIFKQFYSVPMPRLPPQILANMHIPDITIGHHIYGPPLYWAESKCDIDQIVAKVIIDLCGSKGFKANDLCVLPFLCNDKLVPEAINKYIDEAFVEMSFRPNAIRDVEYFLKSKEINNFLIAWALRVKGLEFKVVIMAVDGDDFDCSDSEDRKKAYIMASRCTSMLILVSSEEVRNAMEAEEKFDKYPFDKKL